MAAMAFRDSASTVNEPFANGYIVPGGAFRMAQAQEVADLVEGRREKSVRIPDLDRVELQVALLRVTGRGEHPVFAAELRIDRNPPKITRMSSPVPGGTNVKEKKLGGKGGGDVCHWLKAAVMTAAAFGAAAVAFTKLAPRD